MTANIALRPRAVDKSENKKKRLLLLSYWNNPDEVSASLDSYREYQQLRKHFDTTLVTHARNASALRKSGIPDSGVVYINVPLLDQIHDLFLAKVLNYNYGSLKLTAFLIPYYIAYEFVIWFRLRSEIVAGRFRTRAPSGPGEPRPREPPFVADAKPEDTFLAGAH